RLRGHGEEDARVREVDQHDVEGDVPQEPETHQAPRDGSVAGALLAAGGAEGIGAEGSGMRLRVSVGWPWIRTTALPAPRRATSILIRLAPSRRRCRSLGGAPRPPRDIARGPPCTGARSRREGLHRSRTSG